MYLQIFNNQRFEISILLFLLLQVSSYNEWYYTGLGSDLTFSPATASRLSQPLIGVCTMSHTSHPQKGFTVFQMSSAGDLFYQPFVSPQGDKDSGGRHFWKKECGTWSSSGLGPEAKIVCQKWINIADLHKDNFLKTAPCQVEYVETDKKVVCQNVTSLPESHPCCVLCNDRQSLKNTDLDQAKSESNICQRCGVQISYSVNLVKNQQRKGVLTRGSLCLQHHVEDLGIFPDLKKATDPLSKSLWVNWNSNEPIAVLLSGDQEAENQPDIQEKTVEQGETLLLQNVTTSTSISNSNIVHESSPQKQHTPSKSQVVENLTPKVKNERKQNRHVMGF